MQIAKERSDELVKAYGLDSHQRKETLIWIYSRKKTTFKRFIYDGLKFVWCAVDYNELAVVFSAFVDSQKNELKYW